MSRTRRGRGLATLAVCGGLVLTVSACSTSSEGPTAVLAAISAANRTTAAKATSSAPQQSAQAATCSPAANASYQPLSSLPAPGSLPKGSLEAAIRDRGRLVVGVSGDTRLLGARNFLKGGQLEGFDIEIAKAIGRAIFGNDTSVQFKVITTGQRFEQVNLGADKGGVDLVARAVSMTCARWADPDAAKGSAFSAAYLMSDQRLLVRKGAAASLPALIKALQAGGGTARVCAPTGSTSIAKVANMPGVTPIEVAIHSDCLALWQEGRVDAITGDDVILAGFQAQDPNAEIVGDALDTTPYGLAISKSHPEFVQFVNAVMRSPDFRSAWDSAYGIHLSGALGTSKQFPEPVYGRSPS